MTSVLPALGAGLRPTAVNILDDCLRRRIVSRSLRTEFFVAAELASVVLRLTATDCFAQVRR